MLSTSIAKVAASLRNGSLSATEICELCLNRIEKTKELNSFITVHPQLSVQYAKEADRKLSDKSPSSLLLGIPIAVKDNFCTKGIPTSCGSQMLHNFIPPYTATVVQHLLDHGAVPMGKTNLDEFAMGCGTTDSYFGPTRNPWLYNFNKTQPAWDKFEAKGNSSGNIFRTSKKKHHIDNLDWYIAGGSSGGSAVAVATGAVFGALGSDTGGSTRNPAALCGVVGLKPSYGTISRHGLIPLVNSMDVPGILARTVDDAAVMLNAIAGLDALDSTTVSRRADPILLPDNVNVKGLRVGIPKEYHAPGILSETLVVWRQVADMFDNAGAIVHQVSLPHTQLSIVCYHILNCCEVASNMARYDGIQYGYRASNESSTEALYAQSRHEAFNDVVRSRILAGNYFLLKENYEKYFKQASRIRRLIADDFVNVFQDCDVLLTPTVLSDAPHFSWFMEADNRTRTAEQDVLTQPVNMAGVPAIVVPTSLSSCGLPISLQLIGQSFRDDVLLQTAKWLEQQVNFPCLDINHLDT